MSDTDVLEVYCIDMAPITFPRYAFMHGYCAESLIINKTVNITPKKKVYTTFVHN